MDTGASGPWDFLTGDPKTDHLNVRRIMDTVQSLHEEGDADRQLLRAVQHTVEATGADQGLLLEPQDGELVESVFVDRLHEESGHHVRYSRRVAKAVWHTGVPDVWNGFPPDLDPGKTLPSIGMQSGMAVRLDFKNEPVAVLYVHAASTRREYGDSELKVFRALAALIGTAVQARRLAEARTAATVYAEQVALAQRVQERFSPRRVTLPAGFDVATRADVCMHLSGDYCDVIPRPDGRVAIVIGDVSGKGIRTALYASETRALTRRHMLDGDTPEATLASLNGFLVEDMEPADFMTLFLGCVGADCRSLVYASAAHNPPLLRRRDGTTETLGKTGSLLGMWPDVAYGAAGPIELRPGDVLLLYTDGIYECRNASGELYGEERLAASLDRLAQASTNAQAIEEGLIAELDAFLDGHPREDDVTCVVLRVPE